MSNHYEFLGASGEKRIAERAFADTIPDQPLADFHHELLRLLAQRARLVAALRACEPALKLAGFNFTEEVRALLAEIAAEETK